MLKIYNTLTNQIETFKPQEDKKVNMYVCGPTVYGDIHLGNARPIIFFDVVKRYLKYLGYKVHFVSNITDIDDKIIDKAKQLKRRQREREEEFKSKSSAEMQRQAELKAAAEDDARRDAAQSRKDSEAQGQRVDDGLTDAAKATVKATAKGGVKLARAIKNRIRNRRNR